MVAQGFAHPDAGGPSLHCLHVAERPSGHPGYLVFVPGGYDNAGMAWHPELVSTFLRYWLVAYAVLALVYLVFGYAVSRINRTLLGHYRIQGRACPAAIVRRDFLQSLKSLLSIAAMLAAGLALRQHGYGLTPAAFTWWGFILWTALSLLLFDTWFYWFHRLVHSRRLYKKVHAWHHRATTPTVWANNSDTMLDNLFCQSYWFISPLLLPAPTAVLVAHKLYDQITGMLGHAGHEYAPGKLSSAPSPLIGTTFHDQHHAHFLYNFATHFSIWDRLMGTIHPDYDRRVQSFPNTDLDADKVSATHV